MPARPHYRQRILRLRKILHSASTSRSFVFLTTTNIFVIVVLLAFVLSSVRTRLRRAPVAQLSSSSPILIKSIKDDKYVFNKRQQDVRHVTRATYTAYLNACRGRDEFDPVTNHCHDWFNIGLTTLDSLDTLLLMKLEKEYSISREWAASDLSFHKMTKKVSGFELIIRALAGMTSAYALTEDTLWRDKTVELAELLLPWFNVTKTGCIPAEIRIGQSLKDITHDLNDVVTSPADTGSMQLELRSISQLTGDPRFADAVDRCMETMLASLPDEHTVPVTFNADTAQYSGSRETIGGRVDSFYEMMLKTWIAFGKRGNDTYLKTAFQSGVTRIYDRLVGTNDAGLVFIGERNSLGTLSKTMDHLVCFFPGLLAVASMHGLGGGLNGTAQSDYLPRARALMRSCYQMTLGTEYGLAGEISSFADAQPRAREGHDNSYLRPEIVESLFYLNLIDPQAGSTYKDWGWDMWQRMRNASQAPGKTDGVWCSWSHILDQDQMVAGGKLHSFVIAETFKYFFLLFDDRDLSQAPLPPNEWIFNTEAHPVRIVA